MTRRPDRLFHFWRRVALAVSFALLAACGPGTGGTGTGPVAFSGNTTAAGVGAAPAAGGGCSACTQADLVLNENAVELYLPCGTFTFAGPWDADAPALDLMGRFEAFTATRAAVLRLRFDTDAATGTQVTAAIEDEGGAVLLAPLVLQRRDSPPTALACTR